jgi:hypothetical protein
MCPFPITITGMNMLKVGRLFLIITIALLFTGCESFSPIKAFKDKDKQDSMTKALHSYELTVRWGELAQIYSFLVPELAIKAEIQNNLNNIRVTSYEVIKGPSAISEHQAMQTVKIHYIFNDRQVQKSLIDNQEWTYFEDKREWRRANQIPRF